MPTSRAAVLVVSLAAAAVVAGCGEGDGADASSAAPESSVSTVAAGVAWADDVCSASSELRATVEEARGEPEIDPTGSETSLDQARAQAQETVAAVQDAASALGETLTEIPTGADSGLVEAQEELRTASERAQDAVDQVGTVAQQVTDAETRAETVAGLSALRLALTGAVADVGSYVDTLTSTVEEGEVAVQEAFDAAPACAGLTD